MDACQIFHEIHISKGKSNLRQVKATVSIAERLRPAGHRNMQPACYFEQNEFREAKSIKKLPAATMVTSS
jgi:hypothetical protein